MTINLRSEGKGWEKTYLLSSDEHYDSKGCDRALLKYEWDYAKDNGYEILNFGDFYDVMGGKYDPRTHQKDIRPEYQSTDYFEAISDDGAKFLKDYPIKFLVEGNHEYTVRRKHEFDILKTTLLKAGLDIPVLPYDGFIRFKFQQSKTRVRKVDMYYTHGTGGAAPVTKGVINAQRRQHDIIADIYISGHIHQKWQVPKTTRFLDQSGKECKKKSLHVSLGTYKTDRDQYSRLKGYGSVDSGGYLLTFYDTGNEKIGYEVKPVRR